MLIENIIYLCLDLRMYSKNNNNNIKKVWLKINKNIRKNYYKKICTRMYSGHNENILYFLQVIYTKFLELLN